MTDTERDLLRILNNLVDYAEWQVCNHDETERGGTNWEICCQCGAKWADDEGGRPIETKLPQELEDAYAIIDRMRHVVEEKQQ